MRNWAFLSFNYGLSFSQSKRPKEVHLLPAISADDFSLEKVYERCPDFLGFLHTRLASLRSRLEDVLHLLEVFTGNKRFVRVREHNPLKRWHRP